MLVEHFQLHLRMRLFYGSLVNSGEINWPPSTEEEWAVVDAAVRKSGYSDVNDFYVENN